jgi:hypothetical protein
MFPKDDYFIDLLKGFVNIRWLLDTETDFHDWKKDHIVLELNAANSLLYYMGAISCEWKVHLHINLDCVALQNLVDKNVLTLTTNARVIDLDVLVHSLVQLRGEEKRDDDFLEFTDADTIELIIDWCHSYQDDFSLFHSTALTGLCNLRVVNLSMYGNLAKTAH